MSITRELPWPADKEGARAALLAWRASLDADWRAATNARLAVLVEQRLQTWLEQAKQPPSIEDDGQAPVLAVYWPIRGEPDLMAHYPSWRQMGFRLALPVTPKCKGPLSFALWNENVLMERDKMGISIPARQEWVVPDVLLIPCLGYGPPAFRLGYGGGYYDRTLANFGGLSLGITYWQCALSAFKPDDFDVPLSEVLTEVSIP